MPAVHPAASTRRRRERRGLRPWALTGLLGCLVLGFVLSLAPRTAASDELCGAGASLAFQGCDGIPSAGCCDQARTTRYFCLTTSDEQEITCFSDCGSASCGWDCDTSGGECITWPTAAGDYACGQSPALPDETGDNPWTCPKLCSPSCGGKDCGDDGCGGTCGSCYSAPDATCPLSCNAYGKCDTGCVDCAGLGWECGSNCCGGTCGSCMPPSVCDPTTHLCLCSPDCGGKVCGDDGCGGSCGSCGGGQTCDDAGACVAAPVELGPETTPEPLDEVIDVAPTETPANPDQVGTPDGSPQPETSPDQTGAPQDLGPGDESWTLAEVGAGGECPPGTSLVSGMCLKDPPAPAPDSSDSGGCAVGTAGQGAPMAFGLTLVVLLSLSLVRRRVSEPQERP